MNDLQRLDELFGAARQHELALSLALRVGDELLGLVASTRLQRTLACAQATLDAACVGSSFYRAPLLEIFYTSTASMYALLRRAPTCSSRGLDPERAARWAAAARATIVRRGGPHVFELDAGSMELQQMELSGLHIAQSRFVTNLRGTAFLDTCIEASDFTYANLESTIWRETTVHRSFLRDSSIVDAMLDCVSFFDCDLRNADFGLVAEVGRGSTVNVQFIRCDLRGANFGGRDLSTVDFLDCKLHDVTFNDDVRPSVARADLSPRGDGTWIVGMTAVPEPIDGFADGTGTQGIEQALVVVEEGAGRRAVQAPAEYPRTSHAQLRGPSGGVDPSTWISRRGQPTGLEQLAEAADVERDPAVNNATCPAFGAGNGQQQNAAGEARDARVGARPLPDTPQRPADN